MSTSVGNIHPQGAHHGPVRMKQMHRTELLHGPPTAFIGFWDLRLRNYLDFKYLLTQRDICIPLGILNKWDGTKFWPLSKKKKKTAVDYLILFLGMYLDLNIMKDVNQQLNQL